MDNEKRDQLVDYLLSARYPENFDNDEKRALRRLAKNFVLKNGRILFHYRDGGKTKSEADRLAEAQLVITDDTERKKIVESCHSDVGGGHFGINKTHDKIAERYWWPGFTEDIKNHIKFCEPCQFANPNNKPQTSTLHPIVVTGEFGYRWCIDLVGPLKETTRENRHIVVATEYLTRFAVGKTIRSKEASVIADFIFNDIVCMFGIPRILQHDQGTEFCNKLNRQLCDNLKIKEAISTAYHPQTNGLTERFNQTLVTHLVKLDERSEWDEHVQAILFAYRTSVQSSLKISPFEMLFGAKPRLPIDLEIPSNDSGDPASDLDAAVQRRMVSISEQLPMLRTEGLKNLATAQATQKRQYDAKHQGTYYDIGDWVIKYSKRRDTRQGDKLEPRYTGPYQIHEALGKGVYRLIDPGSGKVLAQKVNSTNLRRFNQDPKRRIDPLRVAEEEAILQAEKENEPPQSKKSKTDDVDDRIDQANSSANSSATIIKLLKRAPAEINFNSVSSTWMRLIAKRFKLKCESVRRKIKATIHQSNEPPPRASVTINGDGNCLFRSLSHAITNSEAAYAVLRQLICEWIKEKSDRFLEDQSSQEYLTQTRMEENGRWGTDVELSAAADLLETAIYCYAPQPGGFSWVVFKPEKVTSEESIFLINLNNHFEPVYKW